MWILKNLSATEILREISVVDFRSSKTVLINLIGILKFVGYNTYQNFSALETALKKLQKMISRKI